MRRFAEMSESDVARTDGFRYDLANRSRAIREAAGRGTPLIETASAGWELSDGAGPGGRYAEDAMNSGSSASRP
jgi:hypothetical protein